jgi:hypothetical protein
MTEPRYITRAMAEMHPDVLCVALKKEDGSCWLIYDEEPDEEVPVPADVLARADEIEAESPPI